jgi:hypothetical protein
MNARKAAVNTARHAKKTLDKQCKLTILTRKVGIIWTIYVCRVGIAIAVNTKRQGSPTLKAVSVLLFLTRVRSVGAIILSGLIVRFRYVA